MKEISRVGIVGMGALGLLFGTMIYDKEGSDAVTYYMNADRVRKYQGVTFTVNEKPYQLKLADAAQGSAVDLLIFAVKYGALKEAIAEAAPLVGKDTIILSVLNGITSEEEIAAVYGREHMVTCIAQGMDAMKFDTALTYTKTGELRIGAALPVEEENAKSVISYCERIGIPHTADAEIVRRMWCKFMLNVGVNQTCLAFHTTYGGCLKKGEANRTMIGAMREVMALASVMGISITESDLNMYVEMTSHLAPDGVPSMAQDGLAGRISELPMFAGTVCRLAKEKGILVPVNEDLFDRITEIESKY